METDKGFIIRQARRLVRDEQRLKVSLELYGDVHVVAAAEAEEVAAGKTDGRVPRTLHQVTVQEATDRELARVSGVPFEPVLPAIRKTTEVVEEKEVR